MVNRRRILVKSLRRLIVSIPIVSSYGSGRSLLASRYAREREKLTLRSESSPAVQDDERYDAGGGETALVFKGGQGGVGGAGGWVILPSDRKEQRKNFHVWTHKIIRTAADFIRELSCTHGSASRRAVRPPTRRTSKRFRPLYSSDLLSSSPFLSLSQGLHSRNP